MSAIREYLEAKAALPEKEWLRREPRTTHPEILSLVAEAIESGLFYDDDVERFVNERVGDLPPHLRHGHEDRERLIYQLGHEVYIARTILRDEAAAVALAELQADGFAPLDESEIVDGARYLVCWGTLYSGYEVPTFGAPKEVRAKRLENGLLFMPKGARTKGHFVTGPALVKVAR